MCFKKVEQNIDEEEQQQANKEINRLNSEYEIQIERIHEKQWTYRRGEDLKVWWKLLSTKVQQERKKEELSDINMYIDTQYEAIQGELKHMLNSLLERSFKKIKINRVMKVVRKEKVLLTEEKDVQNEVRSYFMKQF